MVIKYSNHVFLHQHYFSIY